MKMPNGEQAVIDPQKLTNYCLNPDHELGKHKAKLFREILGIGPSDWVLLRDALLQAAASAAAESAGIDVHGERFRIDFEMTGMGRLAIVRSIWIIRTGESDPRLVTCYIM